MRLTQFQVQRVKLKKAPKKKSSLNPKETKLSRSISITTEKISNQFESHISESTRNKKQISCASNNISAFVSSKKLDESLIINPPLSGKEALYKFQGFLTSFERNEIISYSNVTYLGNVSKKTRSLTSEDNSGFDLTNHQYHAIVGDHIKFRYEILSILGKGEFGIVLKCFDHKIHENVAIKILNNTPLMNNQGRIEANAMRRLNSLNSPNIVKFKDTFVFRSHICIVMELLGSSLYDIALKSGRKQIHIKKLKSYAFQILQGLERIHAAGFIHCDLKPENIVTTDSKTLKFIDFGSICTPQNQIFDYIQSRFYRAPEVMLGLSYDKKIDMWSFGCLLVELLTGKPLFNGKNEQEQIALIVQLLGFPPLIIVSSAVRNREVLVSLMNTKRLTIGISDFTNIHDGYLLNLLKVCLTWDPRSRISAKAALNHPWFMNLEKKEKTTITQTYSFN